jgi:hypothetical protein
MLRPGFYLDPSQMWSQQLAGLGLFGIRAIAPNLASLIAREPPPPLSNLPDSPGKAPSIDDPRASGAMAETANLAMNFLPLFPGVPAVPQIARLLPSLIRRTVPEIESLASRSPRMYNPPPKPLRPFEADYPHGAIVNATTGRLSTDIEGRPLTAPNVVGRRVLGGVDEAQRPEEYDALASALLGKSAQVRPAKDMAGNFGYTRVNRFTNQPEEIAVRQNLPADKAAMVYAHELGHVLDELAGQIPVKGLLGELKPAYNTLNNPNRTRDGLEAASWGKPMIPEGLGYRGADVPPRIHDRGASRLHGRPKLPEDGRAQNGRADSRGRQYASESEQNNPIQLGWEAIGAHRNRRRRYAAMMIDEHKLLRDKDRAARAESLLAKIWLVTARDNHLPKPHSEGRA